MNNQVREWLKENPDWMLRSELLSYLSQPKDLDRIFKSHEYGFLTQDGEFYNRLIELPNFVNIKQVVRASYLIPYASKLH